MAISLSDAAGNAGINAVTALVNSGTLVIYSGTPPASARASLSGNTVLATFTFNATAFGTATAGVSGAASFAAATVTASNTGTATFFRCISSGAVSTVQGTAGTSGADLNLNSTSITSGANVNITSLTLTLPEG